MYPHSRKLLARSRQRFLLINRNYTLLWIGSAISFTGDVLFTTGLTLWIGILLQNQRYAPLAVSGLALAAALPALVIGPFAGVFVDRWQKQKTMRFMDVLRALLMLSLLLVSGPGTLPFLPIDMVAFPLPVKLGAIYLVVAAASSLSQFFNPSTKALLKEIVPEERLTQASALTTGTAMAVWPVGSALAGICYANLGIGPAILLNAASFICSWLLIRSMHVSEPATALIIEKQGLRYVFKDLREGLRCIEENLVLRTLLWAECLLASGLGIFNTMGFFFITQNLHVPVSLFGLFAGVPSFGGILGTWLVGRSATTRKPLKLYYRARVFAGVAIVVTALQSQPLVALAGTILYNIAHSCTESLLGPLLLDAAPQKMNGRVFSTFGTATTLCSLLTTFLSGYLSSTLLHPVAFHSAFITLNATAILDIWAGLALLGGGLYAAKRFRKMKSAKM